VIFTYKSVEGEEGFPGNLNVTVAYRVMEYALHIEYSAVTDKATPVNLTNHSYFNLSGGSENNILTHELKINADRIVDVEENFIPTGKLLAVADSPLDFKVLKSIGSGKEDTVDYDYSWVLNKQAGELAEAASLVHKKSGRCMTVFTTQPAVHFYSGNFLDGRMTGTKNGHVYAKYAGLCLETQHFPDSPNHPEFPNTIIRPGDTYSEKTIFRFSGICDNKTNGHE
jgi:aldose 1-epimerase